MHAVPIPFEGDLPPEEKIALTLTKREAMLMCVLMGNLSVLEEAFGPHVKIANEFRNFSHRGWDVLMGKYVTEKQLIPVHALSLRGVTGTQLTPEQLGIIKDGEFWI
jgi:hypothetical protein